MRKWKKPTAQIFLKRESNRKLNPKQFIIISIFVLGALFYGSLLVIDGFKTFVEYNRSLSEAFAKSQVEKTIANKIAYNEYLKKKLDEKHKIKTKKEEQLAKQHKRLMTLNLLLAELEKAKYKEESFGIGFAESRFKRDVIHPSAPNRVVGMGGIDLVYWGPKLKKRGIDPKGLLAIDYVYAQYLNESSSKKAALEGYKGTIENRFSYDLTKKIIEELKENTSYKKLLESHYKVLHLYSKL